MSDTKTIRFGVVGSGRIVDQMIGGAKLYDYLKLTAVYSRTEERAKEYAARHGAKYTFTSLEEMAASDVIDMVYIASPNRFHLDQAKVFLSHGKHVLCEKPLTAHPEELDEIYALADQNGCLFAEAIIMLFQPQLEILEKAVKKLGPISSARFDFSQYSSQYPAYLKGETPNIFNPEMETGALQDLGVYCVYPALYFFGKPQEIDAKALFLRTGADGTGAAFLSYEDKLITLNYSKQAESYAPSEILGEKGSVTIGAIGRMEQIVLHQNGKAPTLLWGGQEKTALMGYEIATFADWIVAGAGERYEAHRRLARDVSDCMREIRRKAGIRFPRD